MACGSIRVLVMHDAPLVRAGIAAILEGDAAFDVTVAAEPAPAPWRDGGHAVLVAGYADALRCLEADDGDRGTWRAAAKPRVLVVTGRDSEWEIRHAIGRGAHGYVLLDCAPAHLLQGVRALARGTRWFDALVTERIAESLVRTSLTQREYDVLQLVVEGWSNKTIANRLEIALGTVKAHMKAILEKLDVQTRLQAAAVAEQRGMLRVPPPTDPARSRSPAARDAPRARSAVVA